MYGLRRLLKWMLILVACLLATSCILGYVLGERFPTRWYYSATWIDPAVEVSDERLLSMANEVFNSSTYYCRWYLNQLGSTSYSCWEPDSDLYAGFRVVDSSVQYSLSLPYSRNRDRVLERLHAGAQEIRSGFESMGLRVVSQSEEAQRFEASLRNGTSQE